MTDEIGKETFDDARQLMYDELAEKIGEDALKDDLVATLQTRLTRLYDNRDELRNRLQG